MTSPCSRAGVRYIERLGDRCRDQYHAAKADPMAVARMPMLRLFKMSSWRARHRNFGATESGSEFVTGTG